MVEVFKTTVSDAYYARLLLRRIHAQIPHCVANFDLTDCDRILRIQSLHPINAAQVIVIVRTFGYCAEVLSDDIITLGKTG